MKFVYVLDMHGNPLMPTSRFGKVRRMLKSGLASVVKKKPFTIRLEYEPATHIVQQVIIGQDPGRTNIGLSAVRSDGTALLTEKCTTRNKEVPKLMADRKAHRQASRRGERLARKRLAKKYGTLAKRQIQRVLPGCKEPLAVKDIINTESRFNNRIRPEGWLTPTARQLLQTHIRLIQDTIEILPVSDICIELNKFAFMAMDNPDIKRVDYENGPLKGYDGVNEAVYAQQNGKCLLCGKYEIEQYHHIVPRSRRGSNTIDNIAGLCCGCHELVHKEEPAAARLSEKKAGLNKKYGALSILNQIIPFLIEELIQSPSCLCTRINMGQILPGHVYVTNGWNTKQFREDHGIEKDHDEDAYCIACSVLENQTVFQPGADGFEVRQFRRHDRALIHHQTERTYKLDGKKAATNRRKRMEQKTPSLHDWFQEAEKLYGRTEARKMQSRMEVKKSTRYKNQKGRILPGTMFEFMGKCYVMTGQLSGGQYYRAYGQGSRNFPAAKCKILLHNTGLVYVP